MTKRSSAKKWFTRLRHPHKKEASVEHIDEDAEGHGDDELHEHSASDHSTQLEHHEEHHNGTHRDQSQQHEEKHPETVHDDTSTVRSKKKSGIFSALRLHKNHPKPETIGEADEAASSARTTPAASPSHDEHGSAGDASAHTAQSVHTSQSSRSVPSAVGMNSASKHNRVPWYALRRCRQGKDQRSATLEHIRTSRRVLFEGMLIKEGYWISHRHKKRHFVLSVFREDDAATCNGRRPGGVLQSFKCDDTSKKRKAHIHVEDIVSIRRLPPVVKKPKRKHKKKDPDAQPETRYKFAVYMKQKETVYRFFSTEEGKLNEVMNLIVRIAKDSDRAVSAAKS